MSQYFLFVTLFLFITSAQAQITSNTTSETVKQTALNASPKFLFKIGPGFSNLSSSEKSSDYNSKTGWFLAAEYEKPISSYFSLLTGVNYIQKGMKISFDGIDRKFAINYLEVPFLAKANLPISSSGQFSFIAGPFVAVAISKSVTETENGIDYPESTLPNTNRFFREDTSGIDYGARFGVNFEQSFTSSWSFLVGVNYDFGLNNINTNPDSRNTDSLKTRSLLASLGLGVVI